MATKFFAAVAVAVVVVGIMAFAGLDVQDAANSIGRTLSSIDFGAIVKYLSTMVGIGLVLRNKKDEFMTVYSRKSDDESGFVGIVVILALFVFVIMVVLPVLNQVGSLNPGCLFVETPACG